eukprot:3468930-Pyramimonas_sp.AAC.1
MIQYIRPGCDHGRGLRAYPSRRDDPAPPGSAPDVPGFLLAFPSAACAPVRGRHHRLSPQRRPHRAGPHASHLQRSRGDGLRGENGRRPRGAGAGEGAPPADEHRHPSLPRLPHRHAAPGSNLCLPCGTLPPTNNRH